MSIINDFSGNISDIKKNLKFAGEVISDSSKEIARVAKLKLEIAKEEKNLSDLYKEIGRGYYRVHKGIENSIDDPIDGFIREIDKTIARIESLKISLEKENNYNDFSDLQMITNDNEIKDRKRDDFNSLEREEIIYIKEEDLK